MIFFFLLVSTTIALIKCLLSYSCSVLWLIYAFSSSLRDFTNEKNQGAERLRNLPEILHSSTELCLMAGLTESLCSYFASIQGHNLRQTTSVMLQKEFATFGYLAAK